MEPVIQHPAYLRGLNSIFDEPGNPYTLNSEDWHLFEAGRAAEMAHIRKISNANISTKNKARYRQERPSDSYFSPDADGHDPNGYQDDNCID